MRAVTPIQAVELVDHDHGHWCRECASHAAMRAVVALHAATETRLLSQAWCADCRSADVDLVPDPRHCRPQEDP